MTTASRSEREALYLESVESNKDPRDAGPRGKDPGRPWGKTRQSKEAENAFTQYKSQVMAGSADGDGRRR